MQDKIVETLFCIDKKILLNNKINDNFCEEVNTYEGNRI